MTTLTHPHAIEAEQSLLGGLMKRPEAIREIDLDPDDLWRDDHRQVYKLLIEMLAKGEAIDMITVPERVMRSGDAGKYGGASYVIELPEFCPSTANLEYYAHIIRRTADHRRIMTMASDAVLQASRQDEDPSEVAERLAGQLQTIGAAGASEWTNLDTAISRAKDDIERRENAGNGREGLTTGFFALDEMISGLCKGKLYVLGARPAMGKTGLALQMVMAMGGDPAGSGTVGFYSMEMDAEELGERAALSDAGIDSQRARKGTMTADDWEAFYVAEKALQACPLAIDDKPSRSVADIVRSTRKLETIEGGVRGIVVDYLQLMDGKGENQNLRIAAITKGLKALARDMKIPVILLSQLSRDCEKRGDKRPMMSDLRDSGGIEQDADVVAFIYRHSVYNPDDLDAAGTAEVIIRKQRKGPTGTVKLSWNAGRFSDLAANDMDWMPESFNG
jgi:replicative DNA helicase